MELMIFLTILSIPFTIWCVWLVWQGEKYAPPPGQRKGRYRNHYGVVPSSMQDAMDSGE